MVHINLLTQSSELTTYSLHDAFCSPHKAPFPASLVSSKPPGLLGCHLKPESLPNYLVYLSWYKAAKPLPPPHQTGGFEKLVLSEFFSRHGQSSGGCMASSQQSKLLLLLSLIITITIITIIVVICSSGRTNEENSLLTETEEPLSVEAP